MRVSLKRFCAGLLGLVFGVSGVLKLMDPVGTGLIMESYFNFFHIASLNPLALGAGFALSLSETLIAVGLLSGVFRRFFAWVAMSVTWLFTIISIILLVFNPAMDCGCFGQAVHLTHLQTFIKNVILCILAALAFIPVHSCKAASGKGLFSFVTGCLVTLAFAVISLNHIPPVDFTVYAPSHTIVSEEDAVADQEYPTLTLWDGEGNDRSGDILVGDVALISFYRPQDADSGMLSRTSIFIEEAFSAGVTPYILTTYELPCPVGAITLFGDYKDLITLNRSNGGVTFLSDGYIIRKNSNAHMPEREDLHQMVSSDPVEAYIKAATERSLPLQAFILVLTAVLLLF